MSSIVPEDPAMTPQERELVAELFDRLAELEASPRDPDAEQAIAEGLRKAPHAVYALVQTVLVQDEALTRADARIRELEGGYADEQDRPTTFLGGMREALFGRGEPGRGSVPSVGPGMQQMGTGAAAAPPSPAGAGQGGSFLGTAAAAATGVIGGSLMLDGIRSMMGHSRGASGGSDAAGSRGLASPWDNTSGGDLARQAGIDDIGRAPAGGSDEGRGHGLFDSAADDQDDAETDVGDAGDFDFDDDDSDVA
jgi:uncharacterized protein